MRILLGALVIACLLLPTPSLAQSDQDLEKAQSLFDEGQRLYNIREYEQALLKYKEAYLLSDAPELLFNIGQCYRFLGREQDALGSYKTFLRERPDTPEREQVQKLITALEEKIASTPTSAPISQPTATQATSIEVTPPTKKASRSPMPFYAGAAGSLAISGFFGAAFFASRSVTTQLASVDDSILLQDEINEQIKRTRLAGSIANAALGVAILSAGLGLRASKKQSADVVSLSLSLQQVSLSGTF